MITKTVILHIAKLDPTSDDDATIREIAFEDAEGHSVLTLDCDYAFEEAGIDTAQLRVGDEFFATCECKGQFVGPIGGRPLRAGDIIDVPFRMLHLQPIAPVEFVRKDDFELLVVFKSRTQQRLPRGWNDIKQGLPGEIRSDPRLGLMLTIRTERLEEIDHLKMLLKQQPWFHEITTILVRAHTSIEKWFPVDVDAYHQATALPQGPVTYFSKSRGITEGDPHRAALIGNDRKALTAGEEEGE
jgi:hypothetical protein